MHTQIKTLQNTSITFYNDALFLYVGVVYEYITRHSPVTKIGMPALWATSIVPETVVPPLSPYTHNKYCQ